MMDMPVISTQAADISGAAIQLRTAAPITMPKGSKRTNREENAREPVRPMTRHYIAPGELARTPKIHH